MVQCVAFCGFSCVVFVTICDSTSRRSDAGRPPRGRSFSIPTKRKRAKRARHRPAVRRVGARLATARTTLLPNTTGKAPMDAAVKMLDLLDQIDAKLAAL